MHESLVKPRGYWIKRCFDLVLITLILPLILPLLLLVYGLVLLRIGHPVFFGQLRAGFGGRAFRMYKFRSMTDSPDGSGRKLSDGERLTPFGRWLRSTSLDELPELLNIVKGEMSLVGPRPLFLHYLPLYNRAQFRRHEALPGLTGYAQVNGRNSLSWEEKFAWDIRYIDEWSFSLDMRILGKTFLQVLRRNDISAAGEATMAEFTGGRTDSRPM